MGAYHALLSPSSADRWMTCPASTAMGLKYGAPDTSNEYADEGTAAHFLGSECLTGGEMPESYQGRTILVGSVEALGFDGAMWNLPNGQTGVIRGEYEVDDDMIRYVAEYVDAVLQSLNGGHLLVEQTIPIGEITGEAGASGTADAVIIGADGELQIHDLKYGYREVYAEKNRQLMIYALGALAEYEMFGPFTQVRLVIHQPRVKSGPDEWVVSLEDLEKFAYAVRAAAFETLTLINNPDILARTDKMLPTEDGCRYCPAKVPCPKLTAFVLAEVGVEEFEDLTAMGPDDVKALARHSDPEGLSRKLKAAPMVEDWIKAVRAAVEAEILGGHPVPGFKAVQGKRGPRQWLRATDAEEALKKFRLKKEEMYNFKVISPTQAEKILGPKGTAPSTRRWNALQELITQSEGAISIAPEHDKRPAVEIAPVNDFDDLTDDGSDLV